MKISRGTLHGIAMGADGKYVMASTVRKASNWLVRGFRTWDPGDRVRNALLLNRGVMLGVPSGRKRGAEGNLDEFVSVKGEGFSTLTRATDYQLHCENLKTNLLGVVEDNAYLATIPLAYGGKGDSSFVSVYREASFYHIGVILDRKLTCAVRLASDTHESWEGHVGRLRRYFSTVLGQESFPDILYTIGFRLPEGTPSEFHIKAITIPGLAPDDTQFIGKVRALGVAMVPGFSNSVPQFSNETTECQFRRVRTTLFALSIAVLSIPLLLAASLPLMGIWIEQQSSLAQEAYEAALSRNRQVTKSIEENKKLAHRIMRINETFSHRTRWTRFLETLDRGRPDGLFLDRLGSESIANKNQSRVVLTGWAHDEKLVTDFMTSLQKSEFISGLQLSSLMRDPKNESICRFKITGAFVARQKGK